VAVKNQVKFINTPFKLNDVTNTIKCIEFSMANNFQEQEQNLCTNESTDLHKVMSNNDNDIIPNPGQKNRSIQRFYVNDNITHELTASNISTQIEHQGQLVKNNLFPEPVPSHMIVYRIMNLKNEPLFDYERQLNMKFILIL